MNFPFTKNYNCSTQDGYIKDPPAIINQRNVLATCPEEVLSSCSIEGYKL